MAISVQVGDIQSVINRLTTIPVGLEKYVINNMAQVAYDEAERGADKHTKTGTLRQAVENVPSRSTSSNARVSRSTVQYLAK